MSTNTFADTRIDTPTASRAIAAARPVLKWAGGKTQLLDQLEPLVPSTYGKYIEPFFGGGALFFHLRPSCAVVSDSNPEIINFYQVVKTDVDTLIERLREATADERRYYELRKHNWRDMSEVDAAARTMYLNRTCFNGLYRVNRHGQFNVPYGLHVNPRICDAHALRTASSALQSATITCADYLDTLALHACPGDIVYMDPPYIPVSRNSDFKRYTKEQFREADHYALAAEFRRLYDLGVTVILTNSNVPLVHQLFGDFQVRVVRAKRNISCNGSRRRGEDVIVVASH